MTDRRLAIVATAIVFLAGAVAGPAAVAVRAEGPAATFLVLRDDVYAPPDDTVSYSGSATAVTSGWRRPDDYNVQWLGVAGQGGAPLDVGTYAVGPGGVQLSLGYGTCPEGQITILEAPVVVDGNLVSFAADWTGCGGGSIRLASSVPTPALRADRRDLAWASIPFGSTATQALTIRNVGNVALDVGVPVVGPRTGYAGSGDFSVSATTCGDTLPIGETCVLTVAFTPTQEGTLGGILGLVTTPASLGASVILQGWAIYGPAPNDRMGDAVTIAGLPFTSWLWVEDATTDRLDPVCFGGSQRTVWYRYSPAVDGRLELSTAGSSGTWDRPVDTVLGIYAGSPPDDLELVGCADDVDPSDRTSRLRVAVEGGVDYWIVASAGQQGSVLALKLRASVAEPDTAVGASGWDVGPSTVYPYPDGYRDTTRTTALLEEPAWVSIDVFRSGTPGAVLRHADLGIREQGYGWRWDGRDGTGTRVDAGSYVLRHRIRDLFGNVVTHDVPVTVSSKKLVWSTVSKTLDGSRYWKRATGSSTARATVDGRTMILKSGDEWAQAGYRFTVVEAAAYGEIRFEIVGRSTTGRKARISIWDSNEGGWSAGTMVGPAAGTWRTMWVTAWDHLYQRYAYGLVEVRNSSGKVNWIIEKARVVYSYAVLK